MAFLHNVRRPTPLRLMPLRQPNPLDGLLSYITPPHARPVPDAYGTEPVRWITFLHNAAPCPVPDAITATEPARWITFLHTTAPMPERHYSTDRLDGLLSYILLSMSDAITATDS
ncbi:hypothetical protein AVEN_176924-1 [Araneus ventricosus]|uniref:Uncharacterized protein n=1 Tax=Araneus ventricosus TaxID=182803 RepID=A0A4Y2UNA2_ARAVE|nr:hypothetical protein AVEN_176924-1 [Araneus ventricosus]